MGTPGAAASARDWKPSVSVTLPYSRRLFFVPENVYVVATTNTTDRSIAPLDAAIRRRLSFVRLEPQFDHLRELADGLGSNGQTELEASITMLKELNDAVLGTCVGPDAMLGQSYLYGMHRQLTHAPTASDRDAAVQETWRYQILPQLIDGLRAHGAEDLLSAEGRSDWLTDHHPEEKTRAAAEVSLRSFDAHMSDLSLRILVDGTRTGQGCTRGRRSTSGRRPPRGLRFSRHRRDNGSRGATPGSLQPVNEGS